MGLRINPFTGQFDLTGGSSPFSVTGPTSGGSTDNAIARWDGTTGTLLQNSSVTISDLGVINLTPASGANIIWTTDGGGNIGAVGANRPDTIYVKSDIYTGSSITNGTTTGILNADGFIFSGSGTSRWAAMGSDSTTNNMVVIGFQNSTGHISFQQRDADTFGIVYLSNQASDNFFKWDARTAGGSFTLMNATGANILWNTDGSGNIGASGATRPNNAYIKNLINLDTLTASTVLVSNGSKDVTSSTVTSASLGYVLNAEALTTFSMADNQAAAANVTTWAHASFSSIHLEYSIARGAGNRETGDLSIITDGTTVSISQDFNDIGTSGVAFTADISGATVRLRYTSTSTGTAPTMKYTVKKWLA